MFKKAAAIKNEWRTCFFEADQWVFLWLRSKFVFYIKEHLAIFFFFSREINGLSGVVFDLH